MAANTGGSRNPACDNCKERKTKCDRGSPCSSCVAAQLDCRISRRATERRQRILISARYDEAMENVDRSLQEVSEAVQKLLQISEKQPRSSPSNLGSAANIRHFLNTTGAFEGYKGDSSFQAHVQRASDALMDATLSLSTSDTDPIYAEAVRATEIVQEVAVGLTTPPSLSDTASPSNQVPYQEKEDMSLPPLEQVLKLLRLAQIEKQRLFFDIPVIDEREFSEMCQKVYFAVNEYSVLTWAIVNTGLFYLFGGLKDEDYVKVGVTASDIRAHTQLLSANIETAIQSLRLCQDPSLEACQALSVLTTYCIKSGRSSVAWSLISGASRMCIDLGWHRLPGDDKGPEIPKHRSVFWHVYVMDKGMAFTLGRTPSIHQYDVATALPSVPPDLVAPGYVYLGFIEFAVIAGDMYIQLFSAAAQRVSLQTRVDKARSFAAKLTRINEDMKESLRNSKPIDPIHHAASSLLDISMHSLVTVAYRVIPCGQPNSNPLQCNADCIVAARQALSAIVRADQTFARRDSSGWVMFLNMLFSLIPFASFVVLAGNTVASSSAEDLALLSAVISAIEPIADNSVSGKRLFEVCQTFHQFASFFVARQSVPEGSAPSAGSRAIGNPGSVTEEGLIARLNQFEASSDEYVMAPQDWDIIMNEFDLGIGAGAMASFLEPYMPQ